MPMLIVQLAILIAVAFVIGCILGRLLKGRKAADKVREDTLVVAALSTPAVDEKPEQVLPVKEHTAEQPKAVQTEPVAEEEAVVLPEEVKTEPQTDPVLVEDAPVAEEPIVVVEADKPSLLDAPLRGEPDDLTVISGIGKAIEEKLQKLGIFHYAQIAQWTLDEAGWVERNIGFAGRVTREDWIAQAGKRVEAASGSASKRATKPKKAKAKAKAPARSKKVQS